MREEKHKTKKLSRKKYDSKIRLNIYVNNKFKMHICKLDKKFPVYVFCSLTPPHNSTVYYTL